MHIMARGQSNTTARNSFSLEVHPAAWIRFLIPKMGFKIQTIPASSLKGNSLLKNPAWSRVPEQGTERCLTHLAPSAEMRHLPFQLLPKHRWHWQKTEFSNSTMGCKTPQSLTHNYQWAPNGALLIQSLFNLAWKTVAACIQLKINYNEKNIVGIIVVGVKMKEQKKQSGDMEMYDKKTKVMLSQRPKKFWATGQANTKMYNWYEIHRHQGKTEICFSEGRKPAKNPWTALQRVDLTLVSGVHYRPVETPLPQHFPHEVVALHKHQK